MSYFMDSAYLGPWVWLEVEETPPLGNGGSQAKVAVQAWEMSASPVVVVVCAWGARALLAMVATLALVVWESQAMVATPAWGARALLAVVATPALAVWESHAKEAVWALVPASPTSDELLGS